MHAGLHCGLARHGRTAWLTACLKGLVDEGLSAPNGATNNTSALCPLSSPILLHVSPEPLQLALH